jgi:serine/threonine-protein kinase
MAPEQSRRAPVSPATDVFALGVTLFEVLAGRRPFPDGRRRHSYLQLTTPPAALCDHRPGVSRQSGFTPADVARNERGT